MSTGRSTGNRGVWLIFKDHSVHSERNSTCIAMNQAYSNQSNKARGRKEEREKVVKEILEKRRKKEEDV